MYFKSTVRRTAKATEQVVLLQVEVPRVFFAGHWPCADLGVRFSSPGHSPLPCPLQVHLVGTQVPEGSPAKPRCGTPLSWALTSPRLQPVPPPRPQPAPPAPPNILLLQLLMGQLSEVGTSFRSLLCVPKQSQHLVGTSHHVLPR